MYKKLAHTSGCVFGMVIGSGAYYQYASQNEIDFVIAHSGSKFRQMGLPSFSGALPYSNANQLTLDLATKEILPHKTEVPVLFSITATDPTIDLNEYICKLQSYGVTGISNLSSILTRGEVFSKRLEKAGISYNLEVEAIRIAHNIGMFTLGVVETPEQCQKMIDAGCDAISVALGMSSGGILGAEQELSLSEAVKKIRLVYRTCDTAKRKVYKLFYGGPAKTPALIHYVRTQTGADGFLSGYNIERYFLEERIKSGKLRSAFINPQLGSIQESDNQRHYVEKVKEYIEENYRNEIEISQIASFLNISRSYLSALFSQKEKQSIQQYLIHYRLEQAKHLLAETPLSIEDIISLVGYNDYAHFNKSFKKAYGCTATAYRKSNIST